MILLKDEEFIRGNCPMTKEEIRALSIWKLNLSRQSNVLDIGSGTGTITVQCSQIVTNGRIYSIEKDEEAYNITKKNIEKFKCENVDLIKGEAIDILESYVEEGKIFDCIFIGGSGGNLDDIILNCDKLVDDNGTIVMNFITLDNAYRAVEMMKALAYKVEITMVNISKNKENTYMMMANNPIYVVQCVGRGGR